MIEIDIDKLAKLARLALSSEVKERLKPSLLKIVEYFQTIRHLSGKAVAGHLTADESLYRSTFSCPRREEAAMIHSEIRIGQEYLKTLPHYEDGYFQVPKIRE